MLKSWHEWSTAHFVRNLVIDEKRIRPGQATGGSQCFVLTSVLLLDDRKVINHVQTVPHSSGTNGLNGARKLGRGFG